MGTKNKFLECLEYCKSIGAEIHFEAEYIRLILPGVWVDIGTNLFQMMNKLIDHLETHNEPYYKFTEEQKKKTQLFTE